MAVVFRRTRELLEHGLGRSVNTVGTRFPTFESPALTRFNRHLSLVTDSGGPRPYLMFAFLTKLKPANFRTSVKAEHLWNISHRLWVRWNAVAGADYCIFSSIVASKS